MISRPKQNDPIETLLERLAREVKAEQQQHLASFLQRAIARTVDTAVVFAFAYALEFLLLILVRADNSYNEEYLVKTVKQAMPAFALIFWVIVYSPVLESLGGTLGKRLVGIRLVDIRSRQIPPFRLFAARAWIYLVMVVLFLVPAVVSCLAFFISEQRQTWHDSLTNMICIKK